MKQTKHTITRVFIAFLLLQSMTHCKVGRFVVYNFADIKDYRKFPKREAQTGGAPFVFYTAEQGQYPARVKDSKNDTVDLERYLAENKTVAFLIIHNDTIQYERYFRGYDKTSIVPSFSMAKSITSILIGCAIDDGFIQSTDEPITHYIPELTEKGFDKVTIEHLLQMTSGLSFNESYYSPFGDAATFYYGTNLRKAIAKMTLKRAPGTKWEYASGNTQLLGLVLERALKHKTITQYLQEKLWQPLGMEYSGSWSIDRKKNGLEKTFCCINARARDFAKIGRLYLNKGNWNGKQIVSENWVRASSRGTTSNGGILGYKYQWWLPTQSGDFMAEGFLGQFIYVNPAKKLIIVRLGKTAGKAGAGWQQVFTSIASGY